MAATRLAQRRWALVALMAASIAAGVSLLAVVSQNYFSLTQSTLRAKNAILTLSELEGNLKDAETGQRGYLLTGDNSYLEPYLIGAGAAQANILKLETLIGSDDSASSMALEAIQNFTSLKLQELDTTINLRRSKGLEAALPIVQSNAGKTYMDVIRARSNRIRFAQESILSTNSVILNQLNNFRNSVLLLIAFASTGIFWLLFQSFREELSLRKQITKAQECEIQLKEQAVSRLKEAADLKEKELSLRIHDWKNPLSSILTSAELLCNYRDKLSQDKVEKHYKRIFINIDTLLNGFNDALLVAKAEAGKLDTQMNLNNLVIIANNSISAVDGKVNHHTIRLYVTELEYPVTCDSVLVQRALVNLLENALKHTHEGEIGVCLYKVSTKTCIQVGDQGDGIPSEDLQRLFTAFERGNTEAHGTGLGLAVVKHCAEAHQGCVKVESQPGLTLAHPDALTYRTVFTLCI